MSHLLKNNLDNISGSHGYFAIFDLQTQKNDWRMQCLTSSSTNRNKTEKWLARASAKTNLKKINQSSCVMFHVLLYYYRFHIKLIGVVYIAYMQSSATQLSRRKVAASSIDDSNSSSLVVPCFTGVNHSKIEKCLSKLDIPNTKHVWKHVWTLNMWKCKKHVWKDVWQLNM